MLMIEASPRARVGTGDYDAFSVGQNAEDGVQIVLSHWRDPSFFRFGQIVRQPATACERSEHWS